MSDQIEREQQIEEESLTKNSLQIQKAAWIREELEKRRAQEDQLLQQDPAGAADAAGTR